MYIVLVCFGIVTISVLCTVIEIKTEVELICLAVCLGLSLEDLVLEQPIFKSAHNKKTTEGFFSSSQRESCESPNLGYVAILPHLCVIFPPMGKIARVDHEGWQVADIGT